MIIPILGLILLILIIFYTVLKKDNLIAYYLYLQSKKVIPDYSGEIIVEENLTNPIEIIRDKYGVAHVLASNECDGYYGVGYCQAQDRLFQMEISRRMGKGTLSEILGRSDPILSSDIYFLTLGLKQIASSDVKNLTTKERTLVSSYINGINYCVKNQLMRKKLPIEFKLLKTKFEPWTIEDCLLVFRLLCVQMNFGFVGSVCRNEIISKFGEDALYELEYHKNLPKSQIFKGTHLDFQGLCKDFNCGNSKVMLNGFGGSNCFAVSGNHSTTGKPILCSDPHLDSSNPSAFYFIHLSIESEKRKNKEQLITKENLNLSKSKTKKTKEFIKTNQANEINETNEINKTKKTKIKNEKNERNQNKVKKIEVMGLMVPGTPLTTIGRTKDISWGVTLTIANTETIYAEKVKGRKYYYDGKWHKAEIVEEKIMIKGEKNPFLYNVMKTCHGPILFYDPVKQESLDKNKEFLKLSVFSMSTLPSKHGITNFSVIRHITKGKNIYQIRDTLSHLEPVSLNLVFADIEGNIAYQMTGKFQEKEGKFSKYPILPGWLSEYHVKKFIPFEKLPHLINPECGYIVSSNNLIKGDWPFLGKDFLTDVRANRISQLIENLIDGDLNADGLRGVGAGSVNLHMNAKLNVNNHSNNSKIETQNLMGICWDTKSLNGKRFQNILKNKYDHFLNSHPNKQIGILWNKLKNWDCHMDVDSVGASLYETIRIEFYKLLLLSNIKNENDRSGISLLFGNTISSLYQAQNSFKVFSYEIINNLLNNPQDSIWVKNAGGVNHLLEQSFLNTITFWKERKGFSVSQLDQWVYGKIHKLELFHPFSAKSGAAKLAFNSKSVEYGGNSETVCLQSTNECYPLKALVCSAARVVFDLKNIDNTQFVLSSGNNSNIASDFYLNHFERTLNKKMARGVSSKDKIEKIAKYYLKLLPKREIVLETKKQK
ncbi:peptidase s45 penicillin amidase [Anaeramoeba flamelloides]|uniref:Peptidase s45 penicillin amidase n=1 Tax=Anaeramoeba flamelloides TaxID=1746091 RepID=A0AAV7YVI8_9EUKA|nr:peptidase s45 penicillin amidase [Anaeramoeba flamelloides]